MIGRIVEIADNKRHLFLLRGFIIVQQHGDNLQELGRIPIDDVIAVIANAHGITYTNNLLVALAERGIPFVLCGANHNTAGMLVPIGGHHLQAKRFDAQIAASQPTIKRIWADIVKAKLQQQSAVLATLGKPDIPLSALVKKVKSGDPDNIEAQGARRYWTLLFGATFRRDQNDDGINALLNYGYTVLRATTARSVIAAGLHPTIGLHHCNEGNPMRIVDDLMEPFRPMIDYRVWQLASQGKFEINAETKRVLINTMYDDMQTSSGISPVMVCTPKLATSLAKIFLGEEKKLFIPNPKIPTEIGVLVENEVD
ncbi:type II CRISPR-associated endonuclease Cas1 [Undibacterium jejuense]|uniref:CRISPR-associated endonuclease Cas1 n=1 Tax=Undibacterium jejuense TaxID=1344949 RepID=A0A923HBY3_9BURK|nr:type II CRISPR-associated endonuclease Cas1 [Undibacterium jejuense]MBC3860874.1 type II CRISPR-associated endonuclease Cas1 [Undibacterium jejuense]